VVAISNRREYRWLVFTIDCHYCLVHVRSF
jgi:hypothetical protein